jgi:hypothetical protein
MDVFGSIGLSSIVVGAAEVSASGVSEVSPFGASHPENKFMVVEF